MRGVGSESWGCLWLNFLVPLRSHDKFPCPLPLSDPQVCPSFMRQLVWESGGSTLMSFKSQIPLLTNYLTSWSTVDVFDCAGTQLGTVVESYSDGFVSQVGCLPLCLTPAQPLWPLPLLPLPTAAQFTFSQSYKVYDTSGALVGSTSFAQYSTNEVLMQDTSGNTVARGQWSWGTAFSFNYQPYVRGCFDCHSACTLALHMHPVRDFWAGTRESMGPDRIGKVRAWVEERSR